MWPLLGFSLSLALSFYTHYTAALYFILYGLVSVIFLLTREKILFLWIFFGLLFSTILVLPQLYHLFASSLGDPDKDWMQSTTPSLFYSVTMGAFPYPAFLKPPIFLVLLAGFFVLWRRDNLLAVVLALFTGGGMVLAAIIGIYEPIYLVRTIQVFTIFTSVFVAALLVKLPKHWAILIGGAVLLANIYTTAQRSFLPEREYLLAEQISGFVQLLDDRKDRVFAKNYLQRQMAVYSIRFSPSRNPSAMMSKSRILHRYKCKLLGVLSREPITVADLLS